MISRKKEYFSFFGILAATVDNKMQSFYSHISSLLANSIPKITSLLIHGILKPIKTYSTNNLK